MNLDRHLRLLFILAFTFVPLLSQPVLDTTESSKRNNYWLSLDIGGSRYYPPSNSSEGALIGASISFERFGDAFAFRYFYYSEIKLGDFAGNYFSDFSLQYGLLVNRTWGHTILFFGPSLSTGTRQEIVRRIIYRTAYDICESQDFKTFGIALDIVHHWRMSIIGFGFRLSSNISDKDFLIGLTFSLQLGRLK